MLTMMEELTGTLCRKYHKQRTNMKEQIFTRIGGDTWMAGFEGFKDVMCASEEKAIKHIIVILFLA